MTHIIHLHEYLKVNDLVRKACKQFSDHVAIEEGGRFICYDELAKNIKAVQTRLASRVAPRSVVAVVGHRSTQSIVAALAVWEHDCILMPIDDGLPEERRNQMLKSVPPSAVLTCDEQIDLSTMDASPIQFVSDNADHAYIAFTSGSTGHPKAILGSHKGLSHFLQWQGGEFDIGPTDRFAHLTNLSFDVWFRDAFTPLSHGATLCIPKDRHLGAHDLFDFLDENTITVMHTVPSLANHWVHNLPPNLMNQTLRLVFFAGEPLEGVLVKQWQNRFQTCEVINLYGPTETTLAKHFKRISSQPSDKIQSIGHPIPGAFTHILNEQLQPCEDGLLGEICIETTYKSHGYLVDGSPKQPFFDLTLANGNTKNIYRTGDIGLRRPDGEIEVRGRLDDQVKIHGVRIELQEVKSTIASFPGVRDAFVCTIGEGYQQTLAAVLDAPASITPHLTPYLRQQLPAAMIPSRILTFPSLPRLPNGKLNRRELKLLVASDAAQATSIKTPMLPDNKKTIERLESLWKQVLKVEDVDHHRNFFESGGSSLAIVELHARMEAMFQVRFPLIKLFKYTTLQSQVGILSHGSDPDTPTLKQRTNSTAHIAQRSHILDLRQRYIKQ